MATKNRRASARLRKGLRNGNYPINPQEDTPKFTELFITIAIGSASFQIRIMKSLSYSKSICKTGNKKSMNKQELEQELDKTHHRFVELVHSIPEENYSLPTDNPVWTVGDILFHITLGPRALALEVWMTVYAAGLYNFLMRYFPSRFFNSVNAWFGRGRSQRVSRQSLLKAYGEAHAVIKSRLRRTREEDLGITVIYPLDYVSDLKGEVSVERLFRYVTGHFEEHEAALRLRSG